jgi:hypothetical protein
MDGEDLPTRGLIGRKNSALNPLQRPKRPAMLPQAAVPANRSGAIAVQIGRLESREAGG